MTNLHWSLKNSKVEALSQETGIKAVAFSLPAALSCPGAAACKAFCYAKQGRYMFRSVSHPREENFAMAKRTAFRSLLIQDLAELQSQGIGIVRIHDSGDFFSLRYIQAWIAAAEAFPGIRFYAYSKSIRLFKKLDWQLPSNLIIVQSFGGKWDSEIDLSRPYAKMYTCSERLYDAMDKGECVVNGSTSDRFALEGIKGGIGLVYHGTMNLETALNRAA